MQPTRRRRRIAAVIAAVALVFFCLALILRWNPLDLVILRRVGYWALPAAAVAIPLAGIVIAWLTLRNKWVAITVTVVASVTALLLTCVAGAGWLLSDSPTKDLVIASEGDVQLVITHGPDGLGERQELLLRRPAGVLTRESRDPLFCARSEFNDPPPRQYSSARFVSATEVEVVLTDGKRFAVPFSRKTLRPAFTLTVWCNDDFAHPRDLGRE